MAQDFRAQFGLGINDTSISSMDLAGTALAAIQGLRAELHERDTQIDSLQQQVDELKTLVLELSAR